LIISKHLTFLLIALAVAGYLDPLEWLSLFRITLAVTGHLDLSKHIVLLRIALAVTGDLDYFETRSRNPDYTGCNSRS